MFYKPFLASTYALRGVPNFICLGVSEISRVSESVSGIRVILCDVLFACHNSTLYANIVSYFCENSVEIVEVLIRETIDLLPRQ